MLLNNKFLHYRSILRVTITIVTSLIETAVILISEALLHKYLLEGIITYTLPSSIHKVTRWYQKNDKPPIYIHKKRRF